MKPHYKLLGCYRGQAARTIALEMERAADAVSVEFEYTTLTVIVLTEGGVLWRLTDQCALAVMKPARHT